MFPGLNVLIRLFVISCQKLIMLRMCGHVNHVLLPMSHCVCGDAVV